MSQFEPEFTRTTTSRLQRRQVLGMIAYGVILWFVAANMLRELAPFGIYQATGQVWLYLLVWPCTLPFVLLTRKIFALGAGQLGPAFAIGTTAATLLDGLALAWWPSLYGTDIAQIAGAGAAILWGAGVGMALAFISDRRR